MRLYTASTLIFQALSLQPWDQTLKALRVMNRNELNRPATVGGTAVAAAARA